MKKILTLLMILFAVSLVGGLYHTFANIDKVGYNTTDDTYTKEFTSEAPEIILDTIPLISLF
jgi:hypothetical protein